MESEMALEQAGLKAGRGTRDQIVNLSLITKKAREFNQPLFLRFIIKCKLKVVSFRFETFTEILVRQTSIQYLG